MFVNSTNIPGMELWAAVAEGFFNAKCPKHSDNNYEKYIVVKTDTNNCSLERGDYSIRTNEILFKCIRKEGYSEIHVERYLFNTMPHRRSIRVYDAEHFTEFNGNVNNLDTGFTGEYVTNTQLLNLEMIIRGRISNIDKLIETCLYNEPIVIDAYQAIGDFSNIINDIVDDTYPIYIRTPFCDDCSYLFQYQHFAHIDETKGCVFYKFLGIISNDVTKQNLLEGKYFRNSELISNKEYSPFLSPHEVKLLMEALNTAEEAYNTIFKAEDYEKYDLEYTLVLRRFSPKMVIKTKYGVFNLVYDRLEDNAHVYYTKNFDYKMKRIPGYGDFTGAIKCIKENLEVIRNKQISIIGNKDL